jgi:thymidylate kinase
VHRSDAPQGIRKRQEIRPASSGHFLFLGRGQDMPIKQLIFEGNDCSGKTSIAKEVADALKWPIIKVNTGAYVREGVAIGSNELERLMKVFNETVAQFDTYNFILDRAFISTQVYSKVYERKYDISYIDGIIKNHSDNALIIWVWSPLDLVLKRVRQDKENIIEEDNISKIQRGYEDYFKQNKKLHVLKLVNSYDTTIDELVSDVIMYVNSEK